MKKADYMQIIAGYLGKYTAIAAHHKFFQKYNAIRLANISDLIRDICQENDGQKKACLLLRDLPEKIIDLFSKQKISYEYIKERLIFKEE